MKEFRRRRSVKQVLYAPVTIVLLALVLFFLARAVMNVYRSEQNSRRELVNAERNVADLSVRSDFLQREIDKLSSEPGLEAELRNKFPIVKEGEKMVIIVEPAEGSTNTSGNSKLGFWGRILDFFGL
ncbi:MAG: hypothetical protein A3C06_01420 [Candidatus Taylorbacteria bacterium RIFCSPHIGHO2_02_FULL_46_13]|uniref:Cell division protein FtsL n=1 Tax=Candidatus Taylorbacteria bacterium RIFCSPHIGHO2_02_FULL_46_13 TaxID=1802312 RepID=A0A1G2MSQ4_9BACT|nr:MAG: hypothetical protein A3C06_01420 [Candidatus Taylorbacteria bacterium RIFCSPHIGHO2_02_FULL_46_13]